MCASDHARAQKALAFHVTTPERAYWMLAALDRLEGRPEARRGPGPEQDDLLLADAVVVPLGA